MNFKKHIFICTNDKKKNLCCYNGPTLRSTFVKELTKRNLNCKVRANKSGCLDACGLGPVIVIYPAGIWYKNVELKDVTTIIEKSIILDEIIEEFHISERDFKTRK